MPLSRSIDHRDELPEDSIPDVPAPRRQPCRACGEPARVTTAISRDMALCANCQVRYFVCHRCRAVRQSSHLSDTPHMCIGCDCRNAIQPYSAKPTFVPLGEGRHIGVELEVMGDDYCARTALRIQRAFPPSFAITKEDGSLGCNGFEICTRPADYAAQRAAWEPLFTEKEAGRLGTLVSYSDARCGLHVHVSRNNINQHALALMVCFVNLPKNRRFIQVIANRAPNTYTQFHAKRMNNAAWSTGVKYEAVNLNHPDSIEFRIFKGTLHRASFFKALEFVLALSEFCTSVYNVRVALSQGAFIRFVKEHEDAYRYLSAYIDNRWFGKRSSAFATDLWSLKNNHRPPPPPVEFNGDGRAA